MSKKQTVKSDASSTAKPIHEVRGHSSTKRVPIILFALYQFANNGLVSGRTGGDVKMRNGRSRGMKVPALVRNSYTTGVRATMSNFSSIFRGLSQPQIKAWNDYILTKSNRFGVAIQVKGKAAYVALNTNIFNVGGTAIDTPPVSSVVPRTTALGDITADASASTLSLVFTPNVDGTTCLISATDCLSPGISRPSQSAFRNIGIADLTTTSPVALGALYVAKFGIMTAGSKIFIQSVSIDEATGLKSAITQTVGVVVP